MVISKIKKDYRIIIFFGIIFGFLFLFFTKIHPIIFFDTDDWLYIQHMRNAIPIWKDWNPTRILPETLLPLFSNIGIIIFMPLTNNVVLSLTLIHGLVVSILITIYTYCFFNLIRKKFELNDFVSICVTILFYTKIHFSSRKTVKKRFPCFFLLRRDSGG